MNVHTSWSATCLVILLAGTTACQRGPRRFPPLVQEPSVGPLRGEMDGAIEALAKARKSLPASAEDSDEAMGRAERALRRLADYYLPMLEACQRVHNAYDLTSAGDTKAAQRELDTVETILFGVAQAEGEQMRRELREPLEGLEESRLALSSDAGDTAETLRALADRLSLLLAKGRLAAP